jgi:taurine dioxygenase
MPEDAGDALLQELLDHATRPQFIYTHHWRDGDLVMWDNRLAPSARQLRNGHAPRVLHRTVVTGTAPF